MCLWLVEWCDRSWLWRPVLDLQHAQGGMITVAATLWGALMAVLTQHNHFVACDISCYHSHSQAAGLWHCTMPPRGHIHYYVRVFARGGFPLPSPWFSSSWVSFSYGMVSRVRETLLGYSYLVAALWQVCDLTQLLLSCGPPVLSFVCIIHLKAAIAHPMMCMYLH